MSVKKSKIRIVKPLVVILCIILTMAILAFMTLTIGNVVGSKANVKIAQSVNSLKPENIVVGKDSKGYPTIKKTNSDTAPIKILQLTDLHISNGILAKTKDSNALRAIEAIVNEARPDMIVITGDLVFPILIHGTNNNLKAAQVVGTMMETFKIPWTLCYGNHDAEFLFTHTKSQLSDYFESLEYCMFNRGDDITGEGNQVIKVLNQDDSLNTALICMDTNMYKTKNPFSPYDSIHDDQVEWYEKQIGLLKKENNDVTPKTMLFIHIPIRQYEIAYQEYEKHSDKVEFDKTIDGRKGEEICCPKEENMSKIYDSIAKLKSTHAIFCGHDHVNCFSLIYKEAEDFTVRFTYGRSIDYIAYQGIDKQTFQRGGTLITIANDASYTIKSLKLIDILKK